MSIAAARSNDTSAALTGAVVAVFALCIFASAFLLFLVEPMVTKMVLPVVGGTPAVWTTSVLFFQTVLLVGYGYSHWVSQRLAWRWQAALHGLVLLVPLTVLPIHLISSWSPPCSGSPVFYLLLLLAAMVGLPFFVVSTTSPLLQHWFSRSGHPHAADPYFLYRSSNLGSALGLLLYPALIEPHLGLHAQAQAWAIGYVAFLGIVVGCLAVVLWARTKGGSISAPTPAATVSEPATSRLSLKQSAAERMRRPLAPTTSKRAWRSPAATAGQAPACSSPRPQRRFRWRSGFTSTAPQTSRSPSSRWATTPPLRSRTGCSGWRWSGGSELSGPAG